MVRRRSKTVNIGGVAVGGDNPVAIQSMTTTRTSDIAATAAQINALGAAGCEIVRVAVPDTQSAAAIAEIKKLTALPVVADIHFDYRLALGALAAGADKLRVNPGNIGADKIRLIAGEARARGVPIRVGVNSGSLERDILEKYGGVTAEGLAESALRSAELLEDCGFSDIVLSIKASDVMTSVAAHEIVAAQTDYPLHVGITEAGPLYAGSVKSAAGLGAILSRGIGDTVRVSLTADPLAEIRCAKEILRSLGLRRFGAELISCPTCGRTRAGVIPLAERVEAALLGVSKPIKVAVMGCAVNGPGEAREADVGVACGDGSGVIFRKGEVIGNFREEELFAALMREIDKIELTG